MNNAVERLANVLKENQSKLTLDKDGRLTVDLSNKEAMQAIKDQVSKFNNIKANTDYC